MAGNYDLVAIARVNENDDLANLVSDGIRKVKGIAATQTLIAFRVFTPRGARDRDEPRYRRLGRGKTGVMRRCRRGSAAARALCKHALRGWWSMLAPPQGVVHSI